jgi:hypothetical protein
MRSWTQSQIAFTSDQPFGVRPKKEDAAFEKRSVSQYQLLPGPIQGAPADSNRKDGRSRIGDGIDHSIESTVPQFICPLPRRFDA